MTDYNDGKWHGWNGGECPVHPKSFVEVRFKNTGIADDGNAWSRGNDNRAGWFEAGCWTHATPGDSNPIVAFRVIRAYAVPPKPREFWAVQIGSIHVGMWPSKNDAMEATSRSCDAEIIHVREVLE